ncbi:type II toxin-antitoxin system HicB family antitoxin [bacterium 210820-DFI.6.37]|nr:type II toxin-antitoxin system HicB family antitoxin [bacterium 210820-DFI.6.37]
MNKFYPALFHKAEEGGFWVSFPDLPECLTEGDDADEAYRMAVDALGLAITSRLESGEELPSPSEPDQFSEKNAYAVIVEFDSDEYRRRTGSYAVKKTLSIPSWLNEEAMAKGINFSAVLQEALKTQLGL